MQNNVEKIITNWKDEISKDKMIDFTHIEADQIPT